MLVALLGEDALWPTGHGKVGLLYLFATICASLLLLSAEMLSAHALISGQDCASPAPLAWQLVAPRAPQMRAKNMRDPCLRRSAPLMPGWEEGVGEGGGEAAEPLLDKPAQQGGAVKRSTLAVLAGYSAQDTPLLLVAFLAGTAAPSPTHTPENSLDVLCRLPVTCNTSMPKKYDHYHDLANMR